MSESNEPLFDSHEHQWVYDHSYDDWWDGDSDDIYRCSVEGCTATQTRYVPR
jgi:hypothetical protein